MILDVESFVLPRLQELVKNKNFAEFPLKFNYPKEIEKQCILFLGLNPSSSNQQKAFEYYELYHKDNNHPYFKRFQDISKYCQKQWAHLDLLYFRETKQNNVQNILRKEFGVSFIWQQLLMTDYLIKQAEPAIIVVCNTLSRMFLGFEKNGDKNKWLGYDFSLDDSIGTYRWNSIPIFFSSMLTGQRALDVGSYERLRWQINRTLQLM